MDTPETPIGRSDDELVILREYASPLEAEWARTLLASAGICCLIPDSNFNYLVVPVVPIRVQVPASRKEEAEAILKEQEFQQHLFAREGQGEALGDPSEGGDAPEPIPESEAADSDAVDPHELDPLPPPLLCPACGAEEAEETPPPDYAVESVLGGILKRMTGHGWYRCGKCGEVWEKK